MNRSRKSNSKIGLNYNPQPIGKTKKAKIMILPIWNSTIKFHKFRAILSTSIPTIKTPLISLIPAKTPNSIRPVLKIHPIPKSITRKTKRINHSNKENAWRHRHSSNGTKFLLKIKETDNQAKFHTKRQWILTTVILWDPLMYRDLWSRQTSWRIIWFHHLVQGWQITQW